MTATCRARPSRVVRGTLLAALLAAAAPLAGAAGTLTYCIDGAPDGFDPPQFESGVTDDASGIPLYDPLLTMKPGTTEVQPGAARSWDVSADGLVYTLHLRPGVKFHTTPWFKPTREMNADDVMWSLERQHDPAHPAHAMAADGYPYWANLAMSAMIRSIAKVDAMTVRITLVRPNAAFLADLALTEISAVMSAEYAAQLQKAGKLAQMATQPVGTGPFVFRSYQKDTVVRYGANAAYWGGAPHLDQLVFAITVDPAVRAQRVRAGECLVAPIIGDQVAAIEADPRLRVVRSHPLMTSYVAPNTQRPFLSDKRFREALSLAIDRATLIKAAFGGMAEPAGSFLPPGIWSRDARLATPHDPVRARALVKASGYDGRELTLFAVAGNGNMLQMLQLVTADWAAIGVKVRPQMLETGELLRRAGKGEHDLAMASWYSDNGDPDNFLDSNFSCAAVEGGGNKVRYCNPALDALLAAGRATTDVPARTAIYVKAQDLLHAETVTIPVLTKVLPYAVSKRVSGFVATPFGGVDFRNASVD